MAQDGSGEDGGGGGARRGRLAQQLRENLKKRKQQARARKAGSDADDRPAGDPPGPAAESPDGPEDESTR